MKRLSPVMKTNACSPFQAVIIFVSRWGGGLFFLSSNRISRARASCSLSTASSTSTNRAVSCKLPLTIRTFLPRSSRWGSWEINTQKFNKQRRLRESQKKQEVWKEKQQLHMCMTLFGTFHCRHCTTTTWNFRLISHFTLEVKTRIRTRYFFLFHSKLGCGPRIQLQGKLPTFAINARKFPVTFSLPSASSF